MLFDNHQINAAIVLAGLHASDLADALSMAKSNMSNILSGKVQPHEETKRKIVRKLEDLGIEFLPQSGVRKRSDIVHTLDGYEGQRRFNNDRYDTAINSSQDFLYCGTNTQEEAAKGMDAMLSAEYSERMQTIKHFKTRGLRPMTDSSPAFGRLIEYRALPIDEFPPMKFYVYGGKVAILRFAPEFRAIVINDRSMSDQYRNYFERLWNKARPYAGGSNE